MFEAQLLIAKGEGGSAYKVFSPWFPRQGDNATFTVETVNTGGTVPLTVTAYTKNSEDPGNGTIIASPTLTASASAGGTNAATWEGEFEEMVRYEFTVSATSGNWILFRMLPPVWFDSVKA